MTIEKIKKNGKVVAYRSNIYYKGKRILGVRRKTKKEAELDEVTQKKEVLTGKYIETSRKVLDEAFDDYITLVAPKNLGYQSIINAKSHYFNHIQPEFGKRELESIKPIEIQKFLVRKESELANSTIIKLYTLMNQIYKMAISWEDVVQNPLNGVKKPNPNYKKKETLTKEECSLFLAVAKEYQSYIIFWLAIQFGLRLSEAIGLQWEDIDFEERVVHINRAYHEELKKLGRLKSKTSDRSLPLSEQQYLFLLNLKEQRKDQAPMVAANSEGGYFNKRNIRRALSSICKKANIKEITFHELRHTHATLLLEMNEHPKIVQQRLGHAKIETTLNIYSHVRQEIHQESAQRFSDFLDSE